MAVGEPTSEGQPAELTVRVSRDFADWLAAQQISLAFTIPPLKLFLVGLDGDGRLSVVERSFDKPMGLWATEGSLYLATRHQIWRMENALRPGHLYEGGYDRLYVPRVVYATGAVGAHDVALDGAGRLLFVNTRFGCLAEASERYSFVPIWWPPFLEGPAPGDRCHLNGLALRDGRPAYVTVVSTTSAVDSWREHRRDGGAVIDVASGETVVGGLSMPHSPRLHHGRLWLASAGSGELGTVDQQSGRFEPVAFVPGFARGLAFSGDYAIVGASMPRHGGLYSGLGLDEALRRRGLQPRLGLFVVHLGTGAVAHWMVLEGSAQELYDIAVLPGVRRPMALGLLGDEIERVIQIAPAEPRP